MPSINFRDVKPLEGFDPLPPSTYVVEITNAKIEAAKSNPKNEMLKLEYTVVADAESGAGRKVFENMSFTDTSIDFTQRKLMSLLLACGYDEDQLGDEFSIDDDFCSDLVGYELAINVGITTQKGGEYDGRKSNRVNSYAAVDAA
jgi:hypothetical protein